MVGKKFMENNLNKNEVNFDFKKNGWVTKKKEETEINVYLNCKIKKDTYIKIKLC